MPAAARRRSRAAATWLLAQHLLRKPRRVARRWTASRRCCPGLARLWRTRAANSAWTSTPTARCTSRSRQGQGGLSASHGAACRGLAAPGPAKLARPVSFLAEPRARYSRDCGGCGLQAVTLACRPSPRSAARRAALALFVARAGHGAGQPAGHWPPGRRRGVQAGRSDGCEAGSLEWGSLAGFLAPAPCACAAASGPSCACAALLAGLPGRPHSPRPPPRCRPRPLVAPALQYKVVDVASTQVRAPTAPRQHQGGMPTAPRTCLRPAASVPWCAGRCQRPRLCCLLRFPPQACISAAKSEVLNEAVRCSAACLLRAWQFERLFLQVRSRAPAARASCAGQLLRSLGRFLEGRRRARGATAAWRAACVGGQWAARGGAGAPGCRGACAEVPPLPCRSSPAATSSAGPVATRCFSPQWTPSCQTAATSRSSPAARRSALRQVTTQTGPRGAPLRMVGAQALGAWAGCTYCMDAPDHTLDPPSSPPP